MKNARSSLLGVFLNRLSLVKVVYDITDLQNGQYLLVFANDFIHLLCYLFILRDFTLGYLYSAAQLLIIKVNLA